jgi:hypothetical protein
VGGPDGADDLDDGDQERADGRQEATAWPPVRVVVPHPVTVGGQSGCVIDPAWQCPLLPP